MTERKRKKLSRSAREAIDTDLSSPGKIVPVLTVRIRVASGSAQSDLVYSVVEIIDAWAHEPRRWTARKKLAHLARLALHLAQNEELRAEGK